MAKCVYELLGDCKKATNKNLFPFTSLVFLRIIGFHISLEDLTIKRYIADLHDWLRGVKKVA